MLTSPALLFVTSCLNYGKLLNIDVRYMIATAVVAEGVAARYVWTVNDI